MSDDLRRVLSDPAHRLPDSLVDLDAVHAAVRRHRRRRNGLAASGSAFAVVAIGIAVVHPWSPIEQTPPLTVTSPTPSLNDPTSPSPSASHAYEGVKDNVVSVTALSSSTWYALTARDVTSCPSGASCPVPVIETVLLKTADDGASFSALSTMSTSSSLPPQISTVRMVNALLGYGLAPASAEGHQLWRTVDGGHTWIGPIPVLQRILALEAGGGGAWLLVEQGHQVGVTPLTGTGEDVVAATPILLGSNTGAAPALTVQGGKAVVLWFPAAGSRLSTVAADGTVEDAHSSPPCTPDVGVGSFSASVDGLAVSCHNGTGDTAHSSSDGGSTWTSVAGNPGAQRLQVASINATTLAVAGQSGSIQIVTLPAATGTQDSRSNSETRVQIGRVDGSTGGWTWIGFTTEASGFAIDSAGQLFRTTDGGASWTKVTFAP